MTQSSTRAIATALAVAALTCIASSMAMAQEQKDKLAHRKGVIVVKAPAGAEVQVEQLRHEFRWGAGLTHGRYITWRRNPKRKRTEEEWARLDERVAKVRKLVLENFNSITFGSEIKWDFTEKKRGEPNYEPMDTAMDWAEKHDLTVRGHCLFWGADRTPDWVKKLRGKELLAAYEKRAKEAVSRYKGRLVDWDFRNETLNGNRWDERMLGKGIHARITRWVKETDPDVTVCMNEFHVLSSEGKCKSYIRKAQSILKNGGVIDALGCQGHYYDEDFDRGRLKRCLDMLAALKRPIVITEFNMPGQRSRYCKNWKATYSEAQEKRKAAIIRDYLRICFEHPAVDGFYFWYPWEAATWIRASALWSNDAEPKPALIEYRKLVFGEWWTKFGGKADQEGECRVPAFFGRYKVIVNGKEQAVELKKKAGSVTVDFTKE
jgi:GH35 family endo-1,4-beta-xylanase